MPQRGHAESVTSAFTAQAESFNASPVANDAETLEALIAAAKPKRSDRWLEAACGPAVVSRRLAPQVRSVHGVDLTPAMIDVARREAASAQLQNTTFEVSDATATGLETGSFDGAVTRFSIHHIPRPARLFQELARVVRPGGTVVILDHLADEHADARSWAQEIERLRDPSHWASLPAHRLRSLGEDAGLELEDEQVFAYELDFDDWLRRGSADAAARQLVESLVNEGPATSGCFAIDECDGRRVLALRMWLGRWRR